MRFENYIKNEEVTYEQYIEFLNDYERLDESLINIIPSIFKEIKEIIQKLSNDFKLDIKDIIMAFKNKEIFTIIKIGFKSILKAINTFSKLLSAPLLTAFKELDDTTFYKKLREKREVLTQFLDKHPILRKLSGYALAGLIIFIWLNMTFIGSFDFDMDLSIVASAIAGTYTIEHFITSTDMLRWFVLFASGVFLGISCVWLGRSLYNLLMAIVYTYYKNKKPEITKKLNIVTGKR